MTTPKGIWLCPLCFATEENCRLCDGSHLITDLEMSFFEKSNRENWSKDSRNTPKGVITQDSNKLVQKQVNK